MPRPSRPAPKPFGKAGAGAADQTADSPGPPEPDRPHSEGAAEIPSRALHDFLSNLNHDLRSPLNAIIGYSEVLDRQLFGPLGNAQYRRYAKDIRNSGLELLRIIDEAIEHVRADAEGAPESAAPSDPDLERDEDTGFIPAGLIPAGLIPAGLIPAGLIPAGLIPEGRHPPAVLIADDDLSLAAGLAESCRELGLETRTVSNGAEALALVRNEPPGLLVLDIDLPGADGLSVRATLTQDKSIAPMPVVFLISAADDQAIRYCESLGAHYVVKRLDAWEKLKRIVCEQLDLPQDASEESAGVDPPDAGAAPAHPRILVIDDDPRVADIIRLGLEADGVEVMAAHSGMQGYWMAIREKPDLIITDFTMPQGNGAYVIGRLKSTASTSAIPVIVLTGWTIDGRKDYGLEREFVGRQGVAAYLSKPLRIDVLRGELARHIELTAA